MREVDGLQPGARVLLERRTSRSRPQSGGPSEVLGALITGSLADSLDSSPSMSPSCSLDSYAQRFKTGISRPITRTVDCPRPHPSSTLPSSPRLTALLRLFALTRACAKLNRDDRGCAGIVYWRRVTANARTRGARLV